MLSLLVEPFMHVLKQHIALSGMNMTKNKHIESNGLDIQTNLSKVTQGADSLGIIYSRGKLSKEGRHIDFHFYDNNSSNNIVRRGFNCAIPFDLTIVTNQLASLDYLEIIHRMFLTLKTFQFNLIIPSISDQTENIPFSLYYTDVNEKSGVPVSGSLEGGFRFYNFTVTLTGYLLAPYVEMANLVTAVDFKLIPYDGDVAKIGELNEDNSVTVLIPEN